MKKQLLLLFAFAFCLFCFNAKAQVGFATNNVVNYNDTVFFFFFDVYSVKVKNKLYSTLTGICENILAID